MNVVVVEDNQQTLAALLAEAEAYGWYARGCSTVKEAVLQHNVDVYTVDVSAIATGYSAATQLVTPLVHLLEAHEHCTVYIVSGLPEQYVREIIRWVEAAGAEYVGRVRWGGCRTLARVKAMEETNKEVK